MKKATLYNRVSDNSTNRLLSDEELYEFYKETEEKFIKKWAERTGVVLEREFEPGYFTFTIYYDPIDDNYGGVNL